MPEADLLQKLEILKIAFPAKAGIFYLQRFKIPAFAGKAYEKTLATDLVFYWSLRY